MAALGVVVREVHDGAGHYQLSTELTELLRLSYEVWADHFHHENGWDSPEAQRRWVEVSQQAFSVLRREVADFAEVVDERWL